MRKLLGVSLTMLLLPAVASSQVYRPYIVMSGLLLTLTESDWTGSVGESPWQPALDVTGELEMDVGHGVTLAFGYGANPGFSAEIEAGYRTTDFRDIDNVKVRIPGNRVVAVPGGSAARGDMDILSFMANTYYTFDVQVIRPYVGVGIGLAQKKATVSRQDDLPVPDRDDISVPRYSGDDVVFAYQLMLGMNWSFADNTEARVGYRYFSTQEGTFDGAKAGLDAHSIEAGLLISF